MKYALVFLMLTAVIWGQDKPAKRCAFDLNPQQILDTRLTKQEQLFPQPPPLVEFANVKIIPMRTVCPYERAIELFGEDRVRFDDAPHVKRVLVDGETVYEEK